MMANRDDLQKAVEDGCHVLLIGDVQTTHRGDDHAGRLPTEAERGGPVVGTIVRDSEGRLTREGMELYIQQGGSVMHGGRIIDDVKNLPTPADLARGDARRIKQERERLLAHAAAIHAELAKLEPFGPKAEPDISKLHVDKNLESMAVPAPQQRPEPAPTTRQQTDEDEDRGKSPGKKGR